MSTLFGTSKGKKRKRKSPQIVDQINNQPTANNDLSFKSKEEEENDDKLITFNNNNNNNKSKSKPKTVPLWANFQDLGLVEPLVNTCKIMGFQKPTPVQRIMIPFLIQETSSHVLALAPTGSGKTAAFVLPILHHLQADPYGIYGVILTPTRELAKQIHQQVLALGATYKVKSSLIVGGLDGVNQANGIVDCPHICVATPGRLAEILRGPHAIRLGNVRYMVLDEADRLLSSPSGFERDVAELLLHVRFRQEPNELTDDNNHVDDNKQDMTRMRTRTKCQTLLFSATMTKSLERLEEMAGAGEGRLPLKTFIIQEDNIKTTNTSVAAAATKDEDDDEDENKNDKGEIEIETAVNRPNVPAGLKQEYIFMPSRVRDAYLVTVIRHLVVNGGRAKQQDQKQQNSKKKKRRRHQDSTSSSSAKKKNNNNDDDDDSGDNNNNRNLARSAIIFVSTCERAGLISGILNELGVDNVALHSLLSQGRRLAALGKFQSQHVSILVATDVASRGLDIPTVDLVLNAELPRNPTSYVHRVGRTARAGRRGRAISLVSESDVSLVHAAERASGRKLEKCVDITDEMAIKLLGPVTKACRLAKMKLMDIGFDELVRKMKERKVRDRKERERRERRLEKSSSK